jgi:hypothetical protein
MKNNLINLIVTACIAAAAYFGLYQGHEQALNILKFYVWLVAPFVLTVLLGAGFLTSAQRADARKGRRLSWDVVRYTRDIVSFSAAFALVSYGHFVTGAVLFMVTICGMAVVVMTEKE